MDTLVDSNEVLDKIVQPYSNLETQPLSPEAVAALNLGIDELVFLALLAISYTTQ